MKTGPIQLQNQPTRLNYRPFYPNTLFLQLIVSLKSWVWVWVTAWVAHPSRSKSSKQGYDIMIMNDHQLYF